VAGEVVEKWDKLTTCQNVEKWALILCCQGQKGGKKEKEEERVRCGYGGWYGGTVN